MDFNGLNRCFDSITLPEKYRLNFFNFFNFLTP